MEHHDRVLRQLGESDEADAVRGRPEFAGRDRRDADGHGARLFLLGLLPFVGETELHGHHGHDGRHPALYRRRRRHRHDGIGRQEIEVHQGVDRLGRAGSRAGHCEELGRFGRRGRREPQDLHGDGRRAREEHGRGEDGRRPLRFGRGCCERGCRADGYSVLGCV